MSNSEIKKTNIFLTCLYGNIQKNAILYNYTDKINNRILEYKLTKIICQSKLNENIRGMQFFYKNVIDNKEIALIDIKSKEKDLIEEHFYLNGEDIINMNVWLDALTLNLLGFEIITNKNRKKKFGYGNNEQLINIPDFKELTNIILGFNVYTNQNNELTCIYAYYMDKNEYFWLKFEGIFALKNQLSNQNYNEKIIKKLNNMSRENQILYRICKLPKNLFFDIIKYAK